MDTVLLVIEENDCCKRFFIVPLTEENKSYLATAQFYIKVKKVSWSINPLS